MLNFENSCINRPLHNEHKNVICVKKSFIEKDYKQFLGKKKTRATRIFFIFNLFLNFNFSSYILSQIT